MTSGSTSESWAVEGSEAAQVIESGKSGGPWWLSLYLFRRTQLLFFTLV